jgi:hypothetical protein
MKNTKEKSDTSKKTKVKISKIKNEKNMKNTNTNKKNEKNESVNKKNQNEKNKKNEKKIKEPKVTKKAKKVKEEIMEDAEEDMQLDKMMMAMDEIFVKKSGKVDFDRVLDECLKDRDIFTTMNKNEKKRMNQEYQDSFGEIEAFRKSLTKADIENVDTIVYHDENNDGVFAAVSAYHYYSTTYPNRIDQISLVPMKPQAGTTYVNPRDQEKLRGKNILILDLDFHPQYIENVKKISNSLLIIDDHSHKNVVKNEKIFVGTNHAACANTFKFYYPKEEVPNMIKMVDISDSKIGLGEYSNYMNHFTSFIGYRFTHNKTMKKEPKKMMNELWDLIHNFNMNTALFIGHYMDEVQNNLKDQIAINAKPGKFQGYDVGVLCVNMPALKKQIGRQIMTNFQRMGMKIDFAVLWGWEYTSNSYDITLIDDHRPESKIDLGDMARKLGKIGGHQRGGGGRPHQAHFNFPRIPGKFDIWDLFSKKYI